MPKEGQSTNVGKSDLKVIFKFGIIIVTRLSCVRARAAARVKEGQSTNNTLWYSIISNIQIHGTHGFYT